MMYYNLIIWVTCYNISQTHCSIMWCTVLFGLSLAAFIHSFAVPLAVMDLSVLQILLLDVHAWK